MPLVKASDWTPPEDQPVHIYDSAGNRLHTGRFRDGRWYVEHPVTGGLTEIEGVTHWGWIFDSEINDESDDD